MGELGNPLVIHAAELKIRCRFPFAGIKGGDQMCPGAGISVDACQSFLVANHGGPFERFSKASADSGGCNRGGSALVAHHRLEVEHDTRSFNRDWTGDTPCIRLKPLLRIQHVRGLRH